MSKMLCVCRLRMSQAWERDIVNPTGQVMRVRLRETNTLAKVSKPMNIKMRAAKLYNEISLHVSHCACMLSHFSCARLCDPMDYSPPDSSVHGILQARILGWVAMPSSRGSSQPKDRTRVSCLPRWQVGSLPLAPLGKPIRHCAGS